MSIFEYIIVNFLLKITYITELMIYTRLNHRPSTKICEHVIIILKYLGFKIRLISHNPYSSATTAWLYLRTLRKSPQHAHSDYSDARGPISYSSTFPL